MPEKHLEDQDEFSPIFCPRCLRVIGEIESGKMRCYCAHCKVKVKASRLEDARVPEGKIYLMVELVAEQSQPM
jgi:hypothetical protein